VNCGGGGHRPANCDGWGRARGGREAALGSDCAIQEHECLLQTRVGTYLTGIREVSLEYPYFYLFKSAEISDTSLICIRKYPRGIRIRYGIRHRYMSFVKYLRDCAS
jgi:hypothetical protein